MKINKITSFLFIFILAGCNGINVPVLTPTQLPPTPTFTIPSNTSLPTRTPKPTATKTPTLLPMPTSTPMATRVSKDSATIVSGFKGFAISLAWSKDGKTLFVGTKENGLLVYDVESQEIIGTSGNNSQIQALAISPDGKTLAAGLGNDGSIRFISVETGELSQTIFPAHDNWVQVLSFSPDGRLLASGGDDGKILIWDVATATLIKELYNESGLIWGMSFSPDGKLLMAGFNIEYTFRIWNTNTWELKNTFEGDQAADLAFSPDGSKVVTAGGGIHEANIWDVKTGNLLFNLRETPGWTWAVAYAPNGKYVASGGLGEGVILWDVNTGKAIRELYTGGDFLQTLAFNPDGTKLASGGSEVIIWDVKQP
jgi:WD40 repeat protein